MGLYVSSRNSAPDNMNSPPNCGYVQYCDRQNYILSGPTPFVWNINYPGIGFFIDNSYCTGLSSG